MNEFYQNLLTQNLNGLVGDLISLGHVSGEVERRVRKSIDRRIKIIENYLPDLKEYNAKILDKLNAERIEKM